MRLTRWHSFASAAVLAITLGAVGLASTRAQKTRVPPADLVLRGGKIVTLNAAQPDGQALAVVGYRIAAVGSDKDIAAHIGPNTQVIELAGRLVIPGFIEAHGHYLGLGASKLRLDLTKARNWDDIVAMVGAAARQARPGQWLVGRGWHQEKWSPRPRNTVEGVPTHHELSRVSPENPVLLTHASGHAAFANAQALELAGITSATRDPEGGEIVHDASGQPTGLLRESAQRLVSAAMSRGESQRTAAQREADLRRQVELAGQDALAKGVTSFQDAGSSFETIDFFKRLEAEGKLPVRLYVMVRRETNEEMAERLPEFRMLPEGNDYLTVRAIKRQIDGALGTHGAWLLEPFLDLPRSSGLALEDPADIERTAELAIQHGFQVNTHAIGDRGNRETLDIYERVFARYPDKKDLRWRIEHAQHLHPADVPRFAKLGVIAAMQGIHGTSDGPWVLKRLGPERAESGAYLWRDLLDAGAVIANGTDTPVEDVDPIASFYASVSRRMNDGIVFYPRQRMTREEALRSYTLHAAYAAFEEQIKGSLESGKYADLVVVSKDIMTIAEDEIPTARVDYTIVGGVIKYRREPHATTSPSNR